MTFKNPVEGLSLTLYPGKDKPKKKIVPIPSYEELTKGKAEKSLVEAFLKYATHTEQCCRSLHPLNTHCDCGYFELRDKYKGKI